MVASLLFGSNFDQTTPFCGSPCAIGLPQLQPTWIQRGILDATGARGDRLMFFGQPGQRTRLRTFSSFLLLWNTNYAALASGCKRLPQHVRWRSPSISLAARARSQNGQVDDHSPRQAGHFFRISCGLPNTFPLIRRSRTKRQLGFLQIKRWSMVASLLEGGIEIDRSLWNVNTVDIRT